MIDTKRLATDAAYWDVVCEKDGATHYDTNFGFFCNENGFWNGLNEWRPLIDGHVQWGSGRYIPRPTTPAAPEWDGEGLPPVGCECEYRPDPKIHDGWHHCVYLAHYDREHFVLVSETGEVDRMLDTLSPSFRLRPLRTKEQRQRDDLADLIEKHQMENGSFCTPENTAEAIIADGWRKD